MGHLGYWLLLLSNGHDYRRTCSLNNNFQDLNEKSEIQILFPHKVSVFLKLSSSFYIQDGRININIYSPFSQNTAVMTTKRNKRE